MTDALTEATAAQSELHKFVSWPKHKGTGDHVDLCDRHLTAAVAVLTPPPPPPPPPPAGTKLSWAPPALTNPTTIQMSNPTRSLSLDKGKDYILKFPPGPVKPGVDGLIWTQGGRNIVVVGGEGNFDGVVNTDPKNEKEGRVATFFDATGIVHVEGLLARGDGLIEGIEWYSDNAILQVENCRIEHLHVEANQYHSDIIAFDRPGTLRVDRFTSTSELQGISQFFATSTLDLRNVNLGGVAGAKDSSPVLSWFTANVKLTNYWLAQRPGEPVAWALRPNGGVTAADGSVSWPGSTITGVVHVGPPPAGDFVPVGVAGGLYVSPGYAT